MWFDIVLHTVLNFIGIAFFVVVIVVLGQLFDVAAPWAQGFTRFRSLHAFLLGEDGGPVRRFNIRLIMVAVIVLVIAFVWAYRDATATGLLEIRRH